MDPLTGFVFAILMMLLNGVVLGALRREFPRALQAAGDQWRIGTLLIAGGMIVFIAQMVHDPTGTRAVANGLLTLGVTLYSRAFRRFYGLPDHLWMLTPTVLTVLGVFWFDVVAPSLMGRITVSTGCWLWVLGDSLWCLLRHRDADRSTSRAVMLAIYVMVASFAAVRLVWLWVLPVTIESPLDAAQIVNVISPLVMGLLPVAGTTAFVLMCSDRIRREWEHASATDYLTGLPNRRTLNQRGLQLFESSQRSQTPLMVAMVDVDFFKQINDTFGHEVGDEALCHLARVLRETTGDQAVVARMGGEEFVIVSPVLEVDAARHFMDRVRFAVAERPLRRGELTVGMTISAGLSWRGESDANFRSVLRRADRAVYQAKELGRNSVVVLAPEGSSALDQVGAKLVPGMQA